MADDVRLFFPLNFPSFCVCVNLGMQDSLDSTRSSLGCSRLEERRKIEEIHCSSTFFFFHSSCHVLVLGLLLFLSILHGKFINFVFVNIIYIKLKQSRPQLYVNGEFIGGCDIITQMHESGELKEVLAEVKETSAEESSD